MENTNVMVGAYTAYSTDISPEARKVFEEATKGLVGVKYTPLAVSTQVVSGVNYRFFCNARDVYPGALNEAALVEIYQPLKDKPTIRSIKRCE